MGDTPTGNGHSDMTEGWVEGGVYGCPMDGHEGVWFGTWDEYIAHIDADHPTALEPWWYRFPPRGSAEETAMINENEARHAE